MLLTYELFGVLYCSYLYYTDRHKGVSMTRTATAVATPVQTFTIDKTHSDVLFQVRHLVTRVRGRFTDLSGVASFDREQPEASTVSVTINAASIDTGTPDRDA